ncbi:MAG: TonB C-terminal domain-containing protein, partial [Sulfurovum sp.]|nr:TonB C-terminal domain-containing protein [Sulfurovum sp.]MCB4782363.1 TonB C-terminal domain-containing protein [Sulfurovum sp.]
NKKDFKDLFKQLKAIQKPPTKISNKPPTPSPKKQLFEKKEKSLSAIEHIRNSLKKQKEMDSGVEDAYRAHVQEMLEGWPTQSNFAGEKVKVHLMIDPDGHFEFMIKRKSADSNFNIALEEYLKQLQKLGFGPHKGSRAYLFEVHFIAKD